MLATDMVGLLEMLEDLEGWMEKVAVLGLRSGPTTLILVIRDSVDITENKDRLKQEQKARKRLKTDNK